MIRSTERDRALNVIGRIHDGALEARAWPGIVRDVVEFVGGDKGLLLTPMTTPQDGGFVFPHRLPESFMQEWADRYVQHDVWAQAGMRKGYFEEGRVVLDVDLVPEHEYLDSTLYREFFSRVGVARLCSGVIFGDKTLGTLPSVCSVYRDVGDPRFGERERERMQLILPHLSRALGVMYRLRDVELKIAASLAALDRLGSGVFLINERRHVLHLNRKARRALEDRDGLLLRRATLAGRHGTLGSEEPATSRGIESALASCLEGSALQVPHFSRSVAVPRPSGARPYVLNFAPLPAQNSFSLDAESARAIVFLTDPDDASRLDPGLLKKLYGLSPAEIQVAMQLCAGVTVAETARILGLKQTTVRTQLRSIFAKTGTKRQADLVKLLVSLSATDIS